MAEGVGGGGCGEWGCGWLRVWVAGGVGGCGLLGNGVQEKGEWAS